MFGLVRVRVRIRSRVRVRVKVRVTLVYFNLIESQESKGYDTKIKHLYYYNNTGYCRRTAYKYINGLS